MAISKELIFVEKVLKLDNAQKQLVACALYEKLNSLRSLKKYYMAHFKGTKYSRTPKYFEVLDMLFKDIDIMLLDLASTIENLKQ